MGTKLVKVNHITYDNFIQRNIYCFITKDDVKKGDIVLCDTRYGASLGIVQDVTENMSVDELIKLRSCFNNEGFLKYCKPLPDYKNIKWEEECEEDLPF